MGRFDMKRFAVLALLTGLVFSSGCWPAGTPEGSPLEGKKAPSFSAPALGENRTICFPDDFEGQVVVLSFFGAG
ncbi:MAG TPA: hypothetical protein EYP63_02645 [Desulfotomaculum sp.]|nr:hypothetical protein [Desulfotomaculum sp.]